MYSSSSFVELILLQTNAQISIEMQLINYNKFNYHFLQQIRIFSDVTMAV
jgi:hypothetical protein